MNIMTVEVPFFFGTVHFLVPKIALRTWALSADLRQMQHAVGVTSTNVYSFVQSNARICTCRHTNASVSFQPSCVCGSPYERAAAHAFMLANRLIGPVLQRNTDKKKVNTGDRFARNYIPHEDYSEVLG